MTEVTFQVHPMVNLYPRCSEDERLAIKDSVRRSGVKYPIVLWKRDADNPDVVWQIDGRTRSEVVEELIKEGIVKAENGFPIRCGVIYCDAATEAEALDFVEDLNLTRRNMDSSQRAAVAVRGGVLRRAYLAKEQTGFDAQPDEPDADGKKVAEQVAARAGTNREYVYACARIGATHPDILDRVVTGELSVPQAKKLEARRNAGQPDEGVAPPTDPGTPGEPVPVLDAFDREVDPDYAEVFSARLTVKALRADIKATVAACEALADGPGGSLIAKQELIASLRTASQHIRDHQPHCVCPYCRGSQKNPETGRGKCDNCGGVGYLDSIQWKAIPDDQKAAFAPKESEAA